MWGFLLCLVNFGFFCLLLLLIIIECIMSSASENGLSSNTPKVQPWHGEAVDLLEQIL